MVTIEQMKSIIHSLLDASEKMHKDGKWDQGTKSKVKEFFSALYKRGANVVIFLDGNEFANARLFLSDEKRLKKIVADGYYGYSAITPVHINDTRHKPLTDEELLINMRKVAGITGESFVEREENIKDDVWLNVLHENSFFIWGIQLEISIVLERSHPPQTESHADSSSVTEHVEIERLKHELLKYLSTQNQSFASVITELREQLNQLQNESENIKSVLPSLPDTNWMQGINDANLRTRVGDRRVEDRTIERFAKERMEDKVKLAEKNEKLQKEIEKLKKTWQEAIDKAITDERAKKYVAVESATRPLQQNLQNANERIAKISALNKKVLMDKINETLSSETPATSGTKQAAQQLFRSKSSPDLNKS